ncbi:MAG: DUF1961 family protein [Phaeodactylibacter sp.]|nr:DUF1961 family protein [Phaeodactylibacter sp.]
MKILFCQLLFTLALLPLAAQVSKPEAAFQHLNELHWKLRFQDDCTSNWQKRWHKDGERAHIVHSEKGMSYFAGTEAYNDSCHTVLWTKKQFSGNLKIEYDYTRLDTSIASAVNIIYLLASGSGEGPYKKNRFKWNELRRVPAMRTYFNHVNTYHISYAAFGNQHPEPDYVRARRYLPETGKGLEGTELQPEYLDTGLFQPGVKHHITVIRHGANLYLKAENEKDNRIFWFDTSTLPPVNKGRIGLRHMWTRAACYANFKVYEL